MPSCLSCTQNAAKIKVRLLCNDTLEFAFGFFGGRSRACNSSDFRCQIVLCSVVLYPCESWSSVPVLLRNVYNFFQMTNSLTLYLPSNYSIYQFSFTTTKKLAYISKLQASFRGTGETSNLPGIGAIQTSLGCFS